MRKLFQIAVLLGLALPLAAPGSLGAGPQDPQG